MQPFQRLLAPLLLAGFCACSVPILHDVDEGEANGVIAVLQRQGISARKERVASGSKATYVIEVAKSDAPKAWQILREHNLPRQKPHGLGEVFGKPTLVPTAQQERAMMRHALAGEITRTLHAVEGVRQARVHIVIPRKDPLAPPDKAKPEPRAAVLLKVDGESPLKVAEVKRLVSGSVEGLEPARVSVVISNQRPKPKTHKAPAVAMSSVGPFAVAADSRAGLLVTLVLLLLLLLGAALGALLLWVRYRGLKRRLSDQDSSRPRPQLEASLSMLDRSFHRTEGGTGLGGTGVGGGTGIGGR
jgi:type III secretion protein J